MKTKMKMVISVSALCLVLLLVVGITFGVLAARDATVKNSINVKYTAYEIGAEVSATYQRKNGAVTDFYVDAEKTQTKIIFNGSEPDGESRSFIAPSASEFELSKTNDEITFTFTFANTGSRDFTATLTIPTTATNVTLTYTVDTDTSDVTEATTTESNTFTVVAGKTATYTVKAKITNYAKDAEFSGDFSWALAVVEPVT